MSEALPDFLAAGQAWEADIPARRRKRMGQWLTPWWVIQAALDEALEGLPEGATVLDPACGDARWLIAAGLRRPDLRLLGWDLDPEALAAARACVAASGVSVTLQERDSLAGEERGVAALVLGNPPYVRPQALPEDLRARVWARYATATDKCDLYAPFLERMLELSQGRLSVVVADTWLSMGSFQALRDLVWAQPVHQLLQLPAESFAATVGTVLLHVRPGGARLRGHLTLDGLTVTGPLRRVDGLLPMQEAAALEGEGTLAERWRLRMGVVCGAYAEWVHGGPPGPSCRRTCRGRDVQRWQIADRGEWLRYEPRAMLEARPYVAPKWAGLFEQEAKVVLAGATGRVLQAAVDTERRFPLDSCYVSQPLAQGLDPWALCGLLNAAPVNAWYGDRFPAARVKAAELARLPWPRGELSALAEAARAGDQAGVDAAARLAYGLG